MRACPEPARPLAQPPLPARARCTRSITTIRASSFHFFPCEGARCHAAHVHLALDAGGALELAGVYRSDGRALRITAEGQFERLATHRSGHVGLAEQALVLS